MNDRRGNADLIFNEKRNYFERANYYRDLETSYDKTIFNALLVGSGAAFTIYATTWANDKLPKLLDIFVLPALWLFAISLMFTFLSGIFYSRKSGCNELRHRALGNAQSIELAINKICQNNPKFVKEKKINIEEEMKKVSAYRFEGRINEQKADRSGEIAKWLIFIAIFIFGVGLIGPLFLISLSYDFVGIL